MGAYWAELPFCLMSGTHKEVSVLGVDFAVHLLGTSVASV